MEPLYWTTTKKLNLNSICNLYWIVFFLIDLTLIFNIIFVIIYIYFIRQASSLIRLSVSFNHITSLLIYNSFYVVIVVVVVVAVVVIYYLICFCVINMCFQKHLPAVVDFLIIIAYKIFFHIIKLNLFSSSPLLSVIK